jgi:Ca2+-binding RTX toxin-like protein
MRRSAAVSAIVVAAVAALALSAPAQAGYKAKISGGTLTLTGNAKSDKLVLKLKKGSPGTLQIDVGANGTVNFAFARILFTTIVVNAGGGNDTVSIVEKNGIFTTEEVTQLSGGSGRDTLNGGSGGETYSAGSGNDRVTSKGGDDSVAGGTGNDVLNTGGGADTVAGDVGADTAVLGDGDDTFVWDPGDGSDSVQGSGGADDLLFNGSADAETFTASLRAGGGVRVTRSVGTVTLGAGGVEQLALAAGGGADLVLVGDLNGTGLSNLDVDLAVAAAGDAAADSVFVEGTSLPDVISAAAVASTVHVTAAGGEVNIFGSEAANDSLVVEGFGANDTLSGSVGLAALIRLTLDAGVGNDTLNGGNGADVLIGDDGTDTVDGNGGNDTAFLGAGNDTFVWDPGDGSDIVEGQDGTDALLFNGSAGAEILAASSNGGRLLFTRNVGNIVMDCDNVELLTVNALGGIDTATVNDLAATDITNVSLNLGVNGAGDGGADAVTFNGTVGPDAFLASGSGGSVTVTNTSIALAITNAEPANDTLTINTSSGDDLVGASGLANSSVLLAVNAGSDDDVVVGSDGNDTLNGDAGNDWISAGNGSDTVNCGADTDLADGGPGIDVGSNCETVFNIP